MKNTRQWWFAFGKVLVHRVQGQQLPQVASSLTFTTVLSLVPLMTVMLAVFTAFPIFERVQASLQAYLMDSFFPENIASTIIKYVNQFSAKAKGLTLVGIVFLIVTAFSTMLTVDRVFNRIWHVKRHRRLADKVLLYWALMSFSPILLGLSLSASSTVVGRHLSGIDSSQGGFFPVLELISFLITVGAFAFSYRIIPHRAVHWRDALSGGLLASILFEISKRAFAAYVMHFPSYTALYGVLAAFPLFLMWVYLSWLIILLGACCAAALPDVRAGIRPSEEAPSLRWFVALALLSRLDWGRHNQQPRQTLGQLGTIIPVSSAVLDETLNDLLNLGLVGLLAGDNNKATDTFSLICDPLSVSMSYLAKAFWFDVEDLKQWRSFFPEGACQMEKIHRDFLENASLHDWFSLEQVTHK